MNETTARWEDLHLFLSVAREGGLSAAARVTGRSAATLGRRMLSLERSMGRELFVRHERGYELTGEGRDLLVELTEIEARITRLAVRPGSGERRLVKISVRLLDHAAPARQS
ncbi:LysR family transcriptional regulator [Hoeflea alexandrii]|uniref:LysR family transcriptional regulator n=1 Tax=Hoeflea alexandrii TaxID=288436 RepID=UPI0022713691|nr:LysR family transcriptional regulator [Hoeflea alexandrii]MCY0151800.1 LysR family transcriptional regulator [Hoeflea alexandrii]